MSECCAICGAMKNLQRHHTSYEPEIIQVLCVDCHKKVHNHGVGNAKGWNAKILNLLQIEAKRLFKKGAKSGEVANACDITYATASKWKKKFGLVGNRLTRIEAKLTKLKRELEETKEKYEAIGKEIEKRQREDE